MIALTADCCDCCCLLLPIEQEKAGDGWWPVVWPQLTAGHDDIVTVAMILLVYRYRPLIGSATVN